MHINSSGICERVMCSLMSDLLYMLHDDIMDLVSQSMNVLFILNDLVMENLGDSSGYRILRF